MELASSELAREMNRETLLRLIRVLQPIARVALARPSGLQNSTVSSLVEQLIAEGWVREGEAVKTARGRRPTHLMLNDRLSMLAVDVHPARASLAVVDLNGQVLAREEIDMPPDVQKGVHELITGLRALRARFPDRQFEGVGVCLPGRVDTQSGRLMIAPNLRWRDYDISSALRAGLELPIELENDANACLLSELWFGHLDGVQNAVLLAISEGVGASILGQSHLIKGRSGMAGEFGHVTLDPNGPECNCGRRGCWEVFASSRAALGYFHTAAPRSGEITYGELCRRATQGDAPAREAIEKQATMVGRGLRMVMAALAPEVILFAGEFSLSWAIAEPILARECRKDSLSGDRPRLVCTGDYRMTHLRGAAAVVLQRHTGYFRGRALPQAARGEEALRPLTQHGGHRA